MGDGDVWEKARAGARARTRERTRASQGGYRMTTKEGSIDGDDNGDGDGGGDGNDTEGRVCACAGACVCVCVRVRVCVYARACEHERTCVCVRTARYEVSYQSVIGSGNRLHASNGRCTAWRRAPSALSIIVVTGRIDRMIYFFTSLNFISRSVSFFSIEDVV